MKAMLWVVQETPSTKEGKNTKLSREVSTGWVGFDADCFGLAMKPGVNGEDRSLMMRAQAQRREIDHTHQKCAK
jgi:hypothetical protein